MRTEVWDKMEDRIEEAVLASGQKKVYVIYSAYESDEEDEPIDNLDEVAIKGKCVLFAPQETYFGGEISRSYVSPIVENPTWLQLCVLANAMIRRTRDRHHCFLEGVDLCRGLMDVREKITKKLKLEKLPSDVRVYEFCMGS